MEVGGNKKNRKFFFLAFWCLASSKAKIMVSDLESFDFFVCPGCPHLGVGWGC